jgi:hypothetical protein
MRVRCATAVRVAALGVALLACRSREAAPIPPPAERTASTNTLPPPLPTCPGTGHWEPCTVFDRLERAGLAPIRADSLRLAYLRVAGQTWKIGRGTIHIFRYADSAARRADFLTLDSARIRPRGDSIPVWGDSATLLVNDNLLAILLSGNAQHVERVTLALTAGPTPKASPVTP